MAKKKNTETEAAKTEAEDAKTEAAETKTEAEETKTEAAETATEKNSKPDIKAEERFAEKCIYVGPTITKYGLIENTIYKAGAQYPLEAVKKIPALKKLIVPIREFAPALPMNLRAYYNRAARSAKEI